MQYPGGYSWLDGRNRTFQSITEIGVGQIGDLEYVEPRLRYSGNIFKKAAVFPVRKTLVLFLGGAD